MKTSPLTAVELCISADAEDVAGLSKYCGCIRGQNVERALHLRSMYDVTLRCTIPHAILFVPLPVRPLMNLYTTDFCVNCRALQLICITVLRQDYCKTYI